MELRSYWAIVRRRIWVVALIVGVVAVYSAYQYYNLYKTPGALKAYRSDITVQIGLQASNRSTDQSYADYVSTSEALADEFTTGPILTSNEFASAVVQQIRRDMNQITQRYGANANLGSVTDPTAIAAALTATRSHTLVIISASWDTPAGAWAISNAVGEVCTNQIASFLDYEVRPSSQPSLSDNTIQPTAATRVVSSPQEPTQVAGLQANRPALLLVLLLVALVIGIALTFLADYLDDRIRSTDELAQLLQLPIYGEVPRAPSSEKSQSHSASSA